MSIHAWGHFDPNGPSRVKDQAGFDVLSVESYHHCVDDIQWRIVDHCLRSHECECNCHVHVIFCDESVVATVAAAESDIVSVKTLQLVQGDQTDIKRRFSPLLHVAHHGITPSDMFCVTPEFVS